MARALGNLAPRFQGWVVTSERGRLRLPYTDDTLRGYSLGTPLLSLSLPLTSERHTHGVARPFLDGLLPKGDARRPSSPAFPPPLRTRLSACMAKHLGLPVADVETTTVMGAG